MVLGRREERKRDMGEEGDGGIAGGRRREREVKWREELRSARYVLLEKSLRSSHLADF